MNRRGWGWGGNEHSGRRKCEVRAAGKESFVPISVARTEEWGRSAYVSFRRCARVTDVSEAVCDGATGSQECHQDKPSRTTTLLMITVTKVTDREGSSVRQKRKG